MSRFLSLTLNGVILILVGIIFLFYTPLGWDSDLFIFEYVLFGFSIFIFIFSIFKRKTGYVYSLVAGLSLLLLQLLFYSSEGCSSYHTFRFESLVSRFNLREYSYSYSEIYNALFYGLIALWLFSSAISMHGLYKSKSGE